jgi:hypothetical protein
VTHRERRRLADIQAAIGHVDTFDGSVPPYGQVSGDEMATLPR